MARRYTSSQAHSAALVKGADLIGATLVAVEAVDGRPGEFGIHGEDTLTLTFRRPDGSKVAVFVQCDAEGNGPGYLYPTQVL